MEKVYRILCINPGSTSTKLAVFHNQIKLDESNLEHSAEEIQRYPDIVSQLPMRKEAIYSYLEQQGIKPEEIDVIAARGCPAGRVYHAGAYRIDRDMADACLKPENAVHAMCLAPVIAYEWVKDFGIPAYNYDVVMVDEMREVARITGLPTIKRNASCHVLNTKAVAREVAEGMGRSYDQVNLIMCHLGGGCSVSMHEHGRITDAVSNGEGTFSPSRAGTFANNALIKLCFSGVYTEKSLKDLFANSCGLAAHLGTNDCREAERRIEEGDEKARQVYEALAYNIAKDIGTMAVTTGGNVDAVVLTGGIAHSRMLTGMVEELVRFIAPVIIRPGAIEMEALAAGVLRVLRGEEKAYTFAEPF